MTRFRLTSTIFVVWITHHLALGHYTAYDYGFDVHGRVKREVGQASRVVVRGDGGPDIRVRQEIRQLERDQDVWNLYILALSMMQFTDQSEPTSWYGITGLRYHLDFCAFYSDKLYVQEFMGCRTKHGVVWHRLPVIRTLGIVRTLQSYFQPGIGPILPCTRCVRSVPYYCGPT